MKKYPLTVYVEHYGVGTKAYYKCRARETKTLIVALIPHSYSNQEDTIEINFNKSNKRETGKISFVQKDKIITKDEYINKSIEHEEAMIKSAVATKKSCDKQIAKSNDKMRELAKERDNND